MPRGRLRVYFGVAPGAGVTHALLDEGNRRVARGADVVIGVVEDRGRPGLVALAGGLERVGGADGLDTGGLLRRRPDVVLVDNLSRPARSADRTGPPRWEAVERLLEAGIDVVATTDVMSVESLSQPVARLTGQDPGPVVPDRVLLQADQIQIVDIAPQALRRRLAHGGLYAPEEIDAARSAAFRPSTLGALREVALNWATSAVAAQHRRWASSLGEEVPTQPTGERLVVGLSGGSESAMLLHRAARLSAELGCEELVGVHVLDEAAPRPSVELRERTEAVGGRYEQVVGESVPLALLEVARAEEATQVVVGAGAGRSVEWLSRVRGSRPRSVAAELAAMAGAGLDIHVVGSDAIATHPAVPSPRRFGLSRRRVVIGLAVAVVLPGLLTRLLLLAGDRSALPGDTLVLLLGVVIAALVGGVWPSVVGALFASTLLNFFFIPPVRTFRVAEPHNILTIALFVVVAILVSAVVHRAAATSSAAARASAESRALSAVASSALHGEDALPALLDQLRGAFGMRSAALLERDGEADHGWRTVLARGSEPPTQPAEADAQARAASGRVLALSGRTLASADRRILQAFAAQAEGLIERESLARGAAVAARLEATERLRDALLAAVGHDLRTPLASATAAVSSLRSQDVVWTDEERDELLDTAEQSLSRLGRLVGDLLDLSRLRAGVLSVLTEPIWLDEVIAPALDELGPPGRGVDLRVASDLPAAVADPALLTRALVNVTGNALRYSPPDRPPIVSASAVADRVEIRIADHGPGIAAEDLERVFVPFQRLGDSDNRAGLGLGLALSRGLVEAMGGTLAPEETPGGGLTMVITLQRAEMTELQVADPGRRERQDEP